MTKPEWLRVAALVSGLWPSQPWPKETVAASWGMFENMPHGVVEKAVQTIAGEGGTYCPPPGLVLQVADRLNRAALLALPDTRETTPEEARRAQEFTAKAKGSFGEAVRSSWLEFARHANPCPTCSVVAGWCRQPGLQSSAFPPMLPRLCSEGLPLFEAWRYACDELRMPTEARATA